MADIVDIKNLHVTFHDEDSQVYAVRGVNLQLKQGETLAIVGESGSGKSVTTHALLGILPKDATVEADELYFNGEDLQKKSEKEWRAIRGEQISLIFQDPLSALNPTMRVGKQIGEGMQYHEHVRGAKLKQAVYEQIQSVGLPDPELVANKFPHELSGGQRQRVMIAMALIGHPKVLIADEPTTALDVTLQAQILQLIQEQKERYDLSVIFITHDLGVVASIADRVAIMYSGQIVELGTTNEIFYSPQHPYTWGLLDSVPDPDDDRETLFTLPGTPPDLHHKTKGDPFAPRNPYAMAIDFEEEPPEVQLSPTHMVKSWLTDPRTPHYDPPESIAKRWRTYATLQKKGYQDDKSV